MLLLDSWCSNNHTLLDADKHTPQSVNKNYNNILSVIWKEKADFFGSYVQYTYCRTSQQLLNSANMDSGRLGNTYFPRNAVMKVSKVVRIAIIQFLLFSVYFRISLERRQTPSAKTFGWRGTPILCRWGDSQFIWGGGGGAKALPWPPLEVCTVFMLIKHKI